MVGVRTSYVSLIHLRGEVLATKLLEKKKKKLFFLFTHSIIHIDIQSCYTVIDRQFNE